MSFEEVIQAAERRAASLNPDAATADTELDRLRSESLRYFAKLPEPPVYRRADDPVRAQSKGLIPEGEELLVRALSLSRVMKNPEPARTLALALGAHLEALGHTVAGRVPEAEARWREGIELERKAAQSRRIWSRTDERRVPVYDKAQGTSRYDPRPEAMVVVKLACPSDSCQAVGDFSFSPWHSSHQFVCARCHTPFIAYFAEVDAMTFEPEGRGRRYQFRLQELGGGRSRVEFEEASGADFTAARRDLLAFLYTRDRELRAVLNLATSRLLRVQRAGPCFLATAAFGEGAPELVAFRAFRDEVLMRSAAGVLFVRAYYRVGPRLADFTQRRAWRRALVRGLLVRVHARLVAGAAGASLGARVHRGRKELP